MNTGIPDMIVEGYMAQALDAIENCAGMVRAFSSGEHQQTARERDIVELILALEYALMVVAKWLDRHNRTQAPNFTAPGQHYYTMEENNQGEGR